MTDHPNRSADIVEAVTDELLAHGEFSSGANNRSNAREAARAVVDMVRTSDAAQSVGMRAVTIEECARVAGNYPSFELATEHPVEYWIRALASQPSPAATVETKSAPPHSASQLAERAPSSDAAPGGADTQCSAGNARLSALASRIAEIEPTWLPIAGHVRNVTFTLDEADMVIAALTAAEPQSVAWPSIALGGMAYMNERSPYFHDWKGVSLKVVSLRIEPDGKLWASVIEGEQRHRGNGVYDAETTDVDAEHLSPLSRPHGHSRFCAIHTVGDCTCTLASHQLGTENG